MLYVPVYGGDIDTALGTKNITANGTYSASADSLDGYSSVTVAVQNSYTASDEGKVVDNGALVSQTSDTFTTNGTYDTTKVNSVTVDVDDGGIPILSRASWDALTTAQKQAYGLVAVQDASTGYDRGELLYGADYIPHMLINSGTGQSSATFTPSAAGTFKLYVIALNGEASTKTLNVSASLGGNNLTGTTVEYHQYTSSGDNKRNYRIVSFDVTCTTSDSITIALADAGSFSAFVYALMDTAFTTLSKAMTSSDARTTGSNNANGAVYYGTFDGYGSPHSGTINTATYISGDSISTDSPGTNYKSSYIFWFVAPSA